MTSRLLKTLVTGAYVRRDGYWARARSRRAMAAVCYHRVSDGADPLGLATSEPEFALHMRALADSSRLAPVSADTFWEIWSGRRDYGTRVPLLVSFDDGFSDNVRTAAPILKRHGIPAILFVASDVLEGKPLWYDLVERLIHAGMESILRETLARSGLHPAAASMPAGRWVETLKRLPGAAFLRAASAVGTLADAIDLSGRYVDIPALEHWIKLGMSVGAHTCSHPRLTALDARQAELEIIRSKRVIEESLGCDVRHFAYPFGETGDFAAVHGRGVARAGYRMAFTTVQGGNRAGADPFTVRRKCISSGLFARPGSAFSETLFEADIMGLGADLKAMLRGGAQPRSIAADGDG